jgi:hypothetical protein
LILYGIAAILAGASLVLKKEAWRNFGFVSLAIFLFLDGVTTLVYFFNSEYPTYLIRLSVIFSLGSGFYFLFWRQVLKNTGFLMLAGYLISVSVAYFFLADAPLFKTFLVISTIFALPAAVLFFVRK